MLTPVILWILIVGNSVLLDKTSQKERLASITWDDSCQWMVFKSSEALTYYLQNNKPSQPFTIYRADEWTLSVTPKLEQK